MNDLNCLKSLRAVLGDLDVYDVLQAFIHHHVFNNEECIEITNEPNETFRLDLMCMILEVKQHRDPNIVVRFMEALRNDYYWIVEKWELFREMPMKSYNQYQSYRNESFMPSHSIGVYRKNLRWTIHKHLMSLRHGASEHRYLFINGKIGTGKQTLVCQACEDLTVVMRMNYKIFYLDLAYCNTKETTLEMLEKLRVQLGDAVKQEERSNNYSYPSNKIDYWKRNFTQAFEKELSESLLVLAHVRSAELIKDFDFKCKTVVITSNTDVVGEVSESERFVVELPQGFTEDEGLELFARALKKKSTMLPAEATELCRACQGNPFLINLIALRMSEECQNEEKQINWQQHIDNLQNFSIGRSERVSRTITSTLEQFTEEEQQCFRDLVIFRDNVPLSPRVLEMYWGKDNKTTECFLSKLERRGLLEKRVCKNKMFYMMQYICYNDIMHPPGSDMIKLHRRLLKNYSIREKLDNRRELELTNEFPNDDYFHFYIGYHIDKAGEHDLFPMLYQDFGFLEQKLRIAGLANTVGDLRKYQDKIFPHVDEEFIIDALIEFLMVAECLLPEDSRLLQRALNFPGEIGRMAKVQVEKFKNHLWFCDVSHGFESSVIKLCHRPDVVRFQDQSHVFVSLANNDIQLWNLSVDYVVPPMTFKGCHGDQIKDMQKTDQFLVALNRRGLIKVWSTKNPPDRPDYRMRDATVREAEKTLAISGGFSCFCVLKQSRHTELIAISQTGLLCVYKVYNIEFRTEKPDIKHQTDIHNAYILLPLRDFDYEHSGSAVRRCLFLVVVGATHMGIIFNMMSTSIESRFVEPEEALNVHQLPQGLLFVNESQVRLRAVHQDGGPNAARIVYESKHAVNTCSVVTEDKRFVVLGTQRGISIVNISEGVEVRRMNNSHSIVDLDVLMMEESMSHVLLASISKDGENAMNLYSLSLDTTNQYQLEGTTVFLASLEDDPVLLNTVDRHCRLQQTLLHDNDWRVSHEKTFTNENIDAPVLSVIKTPSAYYFGLENGKLLKMSEWHSSTQMVNVANLGTEVTYLDYFQCATDRDNLEVLVIAGKGICKLYVNGREEKELPDTVRKCYLLYDRFLLLIGDRCSIQIYDFEKRYEPPELVQKEIERSYGASAYQQLPRSALILCTADGIIYHLGLQQGLIESSDLAPFDELLTVKPAQSKHTPFGTGSGSKVICSCALSADGEFLAVGCHDGRIILHQLDLNRQLGVLESHQFPVSELYFSNWNEPGAPHILVSVGDLIVFWSVDYLVNNQPRKSVSSIRLSGRFTSRRTADGMVAANENRRSNGSNHSGFSTPVVGSPVQKSFLGERFAESAYWSDKRGSYSKPYLLSCIKLIGRAKRLIMNREFSKFLTMDDEGYIHYLRFYRPSSNQLLFPPPASFAMRPPAVQATVTPMDVNNSSSNIGSNGNSSPRTVHLI